jgi:threonine/homoserine/homoserine lactone efflux protein
MPFETFMALLWLALLSTWTPGPNNAMLASSGATFGLPRTMPHVLGVALGFPVMALIVGLALGQLFQQSALFREVLRWGGAALLLWVAWRIATAGGLSSTTGEARPFRFLEAAAFQWINAKAWVMALAISAQFVRPEAPVTTALIVAAAFTFAGLTSAFGWAWAGQAMRRFLSTPGRLRAFNGAMGGMIALGVVYMLIT